MTTPTGIKTWMEHQQLDKTLRALLLDAHSAPVKSLRRALVEQGVNVNAEAVTQWFRTQLSSPVTPLLPQQIVPKTPNTTIAPPPKPVSRTKLTGMNSYWVVPAGNRKDKTAEEILRTWLSRNMWGMYKSTPGRKHLKAGDRVCFYAAKVGVVAVAEMGGDADELLPEEQVPEGDITEPIYKVPLANVRWLPEPVRLDESLRSQLDAFRERSLSAPWAWFIQTPSHVSEHDFQLLTSVPIQATG